jgi:hypothetical protein
MNWKWYYFMIFSCLSVIVFILWFTPDRVHPWATLPVLLMLAVQVTDTCLKGQQKKDEP